MVVTILLGLIGAIAGFGISDNLRGVVLLALSAISGVLILLFPYIGGASMAQTPVVGRGSSKKP